MRRVLTLATCALAALSLTATAHAATCSYDGSTNTLTLVLERHETDVLFVGARGAIESSSGASCGTANIRNTDVIRVLGTPDGSESFGISEQGGAFARDKGPPRSRGEILILVDLGGWDPSFFTHDTFRVTAGDGDDTITLGSAGLDMNGDGDLDIAIANDPELTIEGAGGNDTISAQGGGETGSQYVGSFTLDIWGATEFQFQGAIEETNTLVGRDGPDLLYAGGFVGNTLIGHGGNDGLFGWFGDDAISGGAGDDSIFGDDGNDSISGGDDADQLHGGAGADTVDGDDGNDTINGESGQDLLSGGAGNDDIVADDRAHDSVDGGADEDRAFVDSIDTVTNVEQIFVR
jgi:Ca2+-binding RTX toxin-like protein